MIRFKFHLITRQLQKIKQLIFSLCSMFHVPCFRKGGFTLIEIIFAIFLFTTGILGVYAAIQQTIIASSISTSKLKAAYLAQEGIEIVRNIRDTNWLEDRTATTLWDDGLNVGDWEAGYNDSGLSSYAGNLLNLESGGNTMYGYNSGASTPFTRKITIISGGTDILKVSVDVSWTERGRIHNVVVQENLYNWK